jgi:hypothetical protein
MLTESFEKSQPARARRKPPRKPPPSHHANRARRRNRLFRCGFGGLTPHHAADRLTWEEPFLLLSRDYVTYISREVVRKLVAAQMIEAPAAVALMERVRVAMDEELSIEDRLNEEVRGILSQWAEEMRKRGASYQEMYKKVKGQLARDRKLILR